MNAPNTSHWVSNLAATNTPTTASSFVKLQAQWTANEYNIVYKAVGIANGGKLSFTSNEYNYKSTDPQFEQKVVYNTSVTLATNNFTKTSDNRSYTVTYDLNGGAYAKSTTNPTQSSAGSRSYTANGWSTSSGTDGTPFASAYTIANYPYVGNLELYPVFTTNTWQQASVAGLTPVRPGYTFDGWFTSQNGGTQVAFPYTPDTNKTLYAHWTLNNYTATMNANGGTVSPTTKTFSITSAAQTLPTATKAGYTNSGYTLT